MEISAEMPRRPAPPAWADTPAVVLGYGAATVEVAS
jgi:hypothetical protein